MLPGHTAGIWSIDITPDADSIVTVSQDKSIRLWARSTDLVFIEEEKERALEALVVGSSISNSIAGGGGSGVGGGVSGGVSGDTDGSGGVVMMDSNNVNSATNVISTHIDVVKVILAYMIVFNSTLLTSLVINMYI